jgi:PTS system glucitol/sorbitol-specific IIA component
MMTEVYRTTVTDAGPDATAFVSAGLFVTFGANAPKALREFCFIVEVNKTQATIVPGQVFIIDGHSYPITAVGDVAQQNLDALGHVTINTDGRTVPKMHGAIHIDCGDTTPEIGVGSVLSIEAL